MQRTRRTIGIIALGTMATLPLAACGGGGFDNGAGSGSTGTQAAASGPAKLSVLIGSSGDAETKAVTDAANAWAKKTGNAVTVTAAADLAVELGKGFSGGTPADVFYLDAAKVGTYAQKNYLYSDGDQVDSASYVPSLVKTFTYDGKLQCAPKDFSTLALVINTDAWTKAGLTDADIPKDWAGLESVAKKLTTGSQTGLVINGEWARLGVWLRQAGGWLVSDDQKSMTASDAKNVEGLTEAQKMLKAGTLKYAKQVDAGWGGEALIKGKAAMTIEGNWIKGALAKDAPDLKTKVVELPAGPAGKGTLMFTNCWGIAGKSANQAKAVDLVKYLTQTDTEMGFAKAFGVMPSTTEGIKQYATTYPADEAFVKGADYGTGPIIAPGMDAVLSDFNTKLEGLANGDPKAILDQLQKNGEAALKG
ncbi:extracellular solute-binding protein [Arsenicicoccus piscis]|uniref:Extracellular solute-binding protein n=1 Tax=Arsenicicoccus piscis TaxID=673954 RepID=A0ABQ6HP95_9MICO|nr:extracellular solute-binding protein [Arsenicicoccus piscis]MCH8628909.1 extracellular solute-binding protein [Arsenicicoccus piscis]GMA19514.1 hypothetical protein GCM10025862_15350 [Arsenicicoccus piscis]